MRSASLKHPNLPAASLLSSSLVPAFLWTEQSDEGSIKALTYSSVEIKAEINSQTVAIGVWFKGKGERVIKDLLLSMQETNDAN